MVTFFTVKGGGAEGSSAPSDADYLVGTADPDLSNEIVVGATPSGELGNTWASPTVNADHSGSSHINLDEVHTFTAVQTFSTGLTVSPDGVLILPTSSSPPSISASGQLFWDSTNETLIIANGSSGRHFIATENISGDGTISTAGVMTVTGGGGVSATSTNTWTAQQTYTTGINLTGGQLIFPATQIASADANTLDDYEEGTFTPTIADDSVDGTGEGQTYQGQVGRYTKWGNQVSIRLRLFISGLGTLSTSEQALITGLPFTHDNTANNNSALSPSHANNLNLSSAGHNLGSLVLSNTAYITMYIWNQITGVGSLTIENASTDGLIHVTGTYEV